MDRITQLFNIMDGVIDGDFAEENLSSIKGVQDYAYNGLGIAITDEEAARIQATAIWWMNETQCTGDWSRVRDEAKAMIAAAPAYLMNPGTGSVDLRDNWLAEMPSWEEGEEEDGAQSRKEQYDSLIEVRKDANGDWVEV